MKAGRGCSLSAYLSFGACQQRDGHCAEDGGPHGCEALCLDERSSYALLHRLYHLCKLAKLLAALNAVRCQ